MDDVLLLVKHNKLNVVTRTMYVSETLDTSSNLAKLFSTLSVVVG